MVQNVRQTNLAGDLPVAVSGVSGRAKGVDEETRAYHLSAVGRQEMCASALVRRARAVGRMICQRCRRRPRFCGAHCMSCCVEVC